MKAVLLGQDLPMGYDPMVDRPPDEQMRGYLRDLKELAPPSSRHCAAPLSTALAS